MPDSKLDELVSAITDLLRPHLERSAAARRAARALGAWLLEAAAEMDEPEPAAPPAERAESPVAEDHGAVGRGPVLAPGVDRRALAPLRIGDAIVHVPVSGTTEELGRARQAGQPEAGRAPSERSEPIDLALIVRRATLKAESCRLYLDRRAPGLSPEEQASLTSRMNAMIAEAKSLPNCFLWVFWRERTPPSDDRVALIGDCYRALAEGAALVRAIDAAPEDRAARALLPEAMQWMATASSALLSALAFTWLTAPDDDQLEAHHWLRTASAKRGVYIARHMRLEDAAEPSQAAAILAGLRAAANSLDEARASMARTVQLFKTLQYHAKRIGDGRIPPDEHDLRRVWETVDQLLRAGVPYSDARFADAVPESAIERLRESASGAHAMVIEALERSRAPIFGGSEESAEAPRAWSERVLRARDLLRGRRVTLIGGEPRPEAQRRIEEAFELDGLDWVWLTEHGTGAPMRAPIQRPETALALVLIRLTGHLHAEEARKCAAAAGKPCVSIPAGYNPEQLAEAILSQASGQLTPVLDG